ncbi:MAG: sugar phosphate nucleotidyltransferase [Defluviitoga tunisiensis]|nr:NTP transferase domain-containing protein [Defluviitaleaceae bacterium]
MKVLILNSGVGSRLKEITKNKPKCLVELYNKETILERQIRLLSQYGLKKFVITTGPFEEKIIKKLEDNFSGLDIVYVKNQKYNETNYIYSVYLAKRYLDEDIILLHGDLVFSQSLIAEIMKSEVKNVGLINKKLPLPEKDFKALVKGERIMKISVELKGENVFAFMPFYKLEKDKFDLWLKEIEKYINSNRTNVYAEEALNEVLKYMNLNYFDYSDYYCKEIDTLQDLQDVNQEIIRYDENEAN